MSISLIVAMAKNRVIGHDGGLPWPRHSADMMHFREVTMGKAVIMGRRTFDSLPGPLEGRFNIVISGSEMHRAGKPGIKLKTQKGFVRASSPEEAIEIAKYFDEAGEIMVIGGASIYKQFLPKADKIYLTLIEAELEGDTFFPEYPEEDWEVIDRQHHESDSKNLYPYTFLTLERV